MMRTCRSPNRVEAMGLEPTDLLTASQPWLVFRRRLSSIVAGQGGALSTDVYRRPRKAARLGVNLGVRFWCLRSI